MTSGCSGRSEASAGRAAIERNACGSCHRIPGVALADGRVGPALDHFGVRQTIAGALANSRANLVAYLQQPDMAGKGNVMPRTGIGAREAQEISDYLEALR